MIRKMLILALCVASVRAELVSIESLFSRFKVTTLRELFVAIDRPLVLDVYGDGCHYCNALSRPFDTVARSAEDAIYFAKFNHTTTAGNQAKSMFGISRIPYIIIVRNGVVSYNGVCTSGSNETAFKKLVVQHAGVSF